ncbi:MAG: porin [Pseudomonadota bacterium]
MKKLIVLVAAMLMVSGMAYADPQWDWYGSARVAMVWDNLEVDTTADQDTFEQAMYATSRVGAKVKVSDELTGHVEYGTANGTANIRLLYGTWNFGGGNLIIGQDYGPLFTVSSLSIYAQNTAGVGEEMGLFNGGIHTNRLAQVKLEIGGFQAALIAPRSTTITGTNAGAATDTFAPAIQLAYTHKINNMYGKVGFGYTTFNREVGALDFETDAWVAMLAGGINVNMFSIKGNVFVGDNVGQMLLLDVDGGVGDGLASSNAADVIDNECVGFLVSARAKFNGMFSLEAGYGKLNTELDIAGSVEDDSKTYYLQAGITLAPGVSITPEIGCVDYERTTAGANDKTNYAAIKWQINF